MDVRCVGTADHGCITPEAYGERTQSLAAGYRSHQAYSNQWGLAGIRAAQGYAHLALALGADAEPGAGVTVGVIDTGIDLDHPAFVGKTVSETFLDGATDEDGSLFSHGTAVASVIAARRGAGSDGGAHGVAWGADLKMFAIPLGSGGGNTLYAPIALDALGSADARYASIFRNVLNRNVDILNASFSFPGIIEFYTEPQLRAHFSRTIAALAQAREKTIIVWAAGNAHGRLCRPGSRKCVGNGRTDRNGNAAGSLEASSVEVLAGLVARIQELRGHVIAVAAVDEDGVIASFSNRCGVAAAWCLVVPGVNVRLAYFGPDLNIGRTIVRGVGIGSGTSYAAPVVSGGLAVMKQLFRGQLSNAELAQRLLKTANKTGVYEDETIYGQGLMDLAAATSPVGGAMLALGGTVVAAPVSASK